VEIKFFYQNSTRNNQYEAIITSFSNLLCELIELPNEIEVCIYPLANNVYGGIDVNRVNRVVISSQLMLQDIPRILTHELIHVSQKHTNLLTITPKKVCCWRGVPYTNKSPEEMTFEEYQNLPWEVDVQTRELKLLQEALELYNNRT
jgi:hypothetical protein